MWLPHLSHSGDTNQFDIQLDQVHTNSGFNKSRWALDFVIVSNAQKTATLGRESTETLDDEHTPGIFTVRVYLLEIIVIFKFSSSLSAIHN